MRKQLLVAFIGCLLVAGGLQAQVAIKPAVGINFNNFSKDPSNGKYNSQVGYQIGGSVAFGRKVYFEPGLFYVKRSTEYVQEGSGATGDDIDFDISGIRVPLTIGFNVIGNQASPVGLRGFGGVSAFFLTDIKNMNKDDFKTAQWGTYLGLGVDLTFVFVEASYEWSLTNLQDRIDEIDVGKTRGLFLNAGVRIPIGGR